MKIKLSVCDDQKHLCSYFEKEFSKYDDIEFVGYANDCPECLELIKAHHPDVLLLDVQMENYDSGVELIPKIKELDPNVKIIMLSIHEENDFILRAFTYGANDYLVKTSSVEEILEIVKKVYGNNHELRPEILNIALSEYNRLKNEQMSMLYVFDVITKLSNSEFEILKALCEGKNYRQISKSKFIEESTVRSHIHRILKKFDTNNIKDLVNNLIELRVFDIFNKKNLGD